MGVDDDVSTVACSVGTILQNNHDVGMHVSVKILHTLRAKSARNRALFAHIF